MGSLFNVDGPLATALNRVADFVILNLLWIICCIPVITIGPATTACYYVALRMVNNEESYIARNFFKSFKENFKQGCILGIILLAAGILLRVDIYILNHIEASYAKVFVYIFYPLSMLYAMTAVYVFPLLAKFENSVRKTITNAFFMAVRHLPWTILILVVTLLPVIVLLAVPSVFGYELLVMLLCGFSLIAYVNAKVFNRIFARYIEE